MNIAAIGGGSRANAIEFARERMNGQNVLIIPSSCSNPNAFEADGKVAKTVQAFTDQGFNTTLLHEHGEVPSQTKIDHEFGSADLMYILGGNTPYLIDNIKKHGTDKAMIQAVKAGAWLTGMSAGALLPFEKGFSCPAKRPESEAEAGWEYATYDTLGILPVAATVHADGYDPIYSGSPNVTKTLEGTRLDYFIASGLGNSARGVSMANGATIAVHDGAVHTLYQSPETQRVMALENTGGVITQHADYDDTALTQFIFDR